MVATALRGEVGIMRRASKSSLPGASSRKCDCEEAFWTKELGGSRCLRHVGKVNWLTHGGLRYEKEFDGVQDVFELQVQIPHASDLQWYDAGSDISLISAI